MSRLNLPMVDPPALSGLKPVVLRVAVIYLCLPLWELASDVSNDTHTRLSDTLACHIRAWGQGSMAGDRVVPSSPFPFPTPFPMLLRHLQARERADTLNSLREVPTGSDALLV